MKPEPNNDTNRPREAPERPEAERWLAVSTGAQVAILTQDEYCGLKRQIAEHRGGKKNV